MKATVSLNKLNKIISKLSGIKDTEERYGILPRFIQDTVPGNLLSGTYENYVVTKDAELVQQKNLLQQELERKHMKFALKSVLLTENVKSGIHNLLTNIAIAEATIATLKPLLDTDQKNLLTVEQFNFIKGSATATVSSGDYRTVVDREILQQQIEGLHKEITEAQDKIAELNYATKVDIEFPDSIVKLLGL